MRQVHVKLVSSLPRKVHGKVKLRDKVVDVAQESSHGASGACDDLLEALIHCSCDEESTKGMPQIVAGCAGHLAGRSHQAAGGDAVGTIGMTGPGSTALIMLKCDLLM